MARHHGGVPLRDLPARLGRERIAARMDKPFRHEPAHRRERLGDRHHGGGLQPVPDAMTMEPRAAHGGTRRPRRNANDLHGSALARCLRLQALMRPMRVFLLIGILSAAACSGAVTPDLPSPDAGGSSSGEGASSGAPGAAANGGGAAASGSGTTPTGGQGTGGAGSGSASSGTATTPNPPAPVSPPAVDAGATAPPPSGSNSGGSPGGGGSGSGAGSSGGGDRPTSGSGSSSGSGMGAGSSSGPTPKGPDCSGLPIPAIAKICPDGKGVGATYVVVNGVCTLECPCPSGPTIDAGTLPPPPPPPASCAVDGAACNQGEGCGSSDGNGCTSSCTCNASGHFHCTTVCAPPPPPPTPPACGTANGVACIDAGTPTGCVQGAVCSPNEGCGSGGPPGTCSTSCGCNPSGHFLCKRTCPDAGAP